MAEARSAIDLYYLQKQGFDIAGVEDGYFKVSFSIPYPRTVAQTAVDKFRRLVKFVQNRIWPASIKTVVGVMASVSVAALSAPKDTFLFSLLRSSALADGLWKLDSVANQWNPIHSKLAVEVRVGYIAAIASLVGMLGIVSVERGMLRLLLHYKGWLFLSPKDSKNPPIYVKVWGALVSLFSRNGHMGLTYSYAEALPSLPLPSLGKTVERYLRSVKPLMATQDFEDVEKQATKFLKGDGKKLQRFLGLKWLVSNNYVADWWEKYVYLRGRTPLCVNSNYYITDSKFRPTTRQTERASNIAHYFLKFKDLIEQEKLAPLLIKGRVPLCMEQYTRMFGTCRIPGMEFDQLKHMESRHIVVLYKGLYFELDVYHGARGTTLTPYSREEIKYQLDVIVNYVDNLQLNDNINDFTLDLEPIWKEDDADRRRPGHLSKQNKRRIQSYSDLLMLNSKTAYEAEEKNGEVMINDRLDANIACFTAGPRTRWAEIRNLHFSSGANKASLRSIEKAAFVLVLDGMLGSDLNTRAKSLFHGSGNNRYFDKSLSLIVFKDGYAGLNTEHSWADAPCVAHLWEFALLNELSHYVGQITPAPGRRKSVLVDEIEFTATELDQKGAEVFKDVSKPKRLVWDFTSDLKRSMKQAQEFAGELIADLDLEVMEFEEFGAGLMKKNGFSPDCFIQMALQLAYFRDQGRFDLTYESSMTRLFRRGRTETIRSLSIESKEFVKTFEDSSISNAEKKEKLRIACEHHNIVTKESMAGKGVDRHLFALYITSRGFDINCDFLNDALSLPWKFSTSQQTQHQTNMRDGLPPEIAAKFLSPGGGFGPVADDGYGVSYMVVKNDRVFFHVSSKNSAKNTSSLEFMKNLKQSLLDIRDMLDNQ